MPNHLANASSPYLRMHADNPVDWQPWNAAVLKHARDTDTPILLSIGYSACHWCHVMAHECFENPDIAARMNRSFVNIKLDREERPDIDRVYQLAHQALNGRGGGWPLTAFLDPQTLSPFYIGTYFPPTPRHGLPGLPEVLERVRAYFDGHRNEFRDHAAALGTWMRQVDAAGAGEVPAADAADNAALQRITARFDPDWGGTRGAPKFPRSPELEWLLDRQRQDNAGAMACRAVTMMATRGLQDHLGGGFFRYCVDADWTIPHFEKMLYDNTQLLPVFARAASLGGAEAAMRDVAASAAHGIVAWLAREMTASDGTFYSSLDADSDGTEGGFYLWTREQALAAIPGPAHPVAERAFGLDQPANFEHKAWHLMRTTPLDNIAWQLGRSPDTDASDYANARDALFKQREQRPHPARDDKVLTAWNALAVSGLARTARLLDHRQSAAMATRALAALRESVWVDGALFANAAGPQARIPAFLDDHAFLLDALLEVLQLEFEPGNLEWAIALADVLLDKFADREAGGFWFSTPEHVTPLARGRNWTDDALPNGNGIATLALLRLGHLTGETRYLDGAEQALRAGAGALGQFPDACPSLLRALHEFEHPRTQVVVRSPQTLTAKWQAAVREAIRTDGGPADVFIIPSQCDALPGLLATRTSRGEDGTAYVCSGLTCQAPVTSPDELAAVMRAIE